MTAQLSLTLSGTFIHVQHEEACPDIGPVCATMPQQPYQHDQHLYSTDLTFDGELGLVRHLSVEVVAGLRQVTDRISYLDLQGNAYTPPLPDYHHLNEALVGPSDPWLMLHSGVVWHQWIFSAKGGVTFPLGSTVPNPFALGRLGLPHEHIQFGTGTFDPVAGASVGRQFEHFSASLWTLDRVTLGTNHYGYRSGDKVLIGLQATSGFGLARWSFTVGFDFYRETPERWSGVIEQEGNLGRTDYILDASAVWLFARTWTLAMGIKVPVYTVAQGEQASYPAILNVGITRMLGAPGP